MYYATKIQINQSHPLFQYCDVVTKAANNLNNATHFRVRQVLTMVEKTAAPHFLHLLIGDLIVPLVICGKESVLAVYKSWEMFFRANSPMFSQ